MSFRGGGSMLPPIYDPVAVEPLWKELAAVGVEPLTQPEQVDAALTAGTGTVLVIVNSVCGCAAGQARPGAMLALQGEVIPDRFVTVFAGVDRDAVEAARQHMTGFPPSSPSMGLFKDGKLVFMLQRTDLQQMNEEQVSAALRGALPAPGPLHRPGPVQGDPALPGLRLADPAGPRAVVQLARAVPRASPSLPARPSARRGRPLPPGRR